MTRILAIDTYSDECAIAFFASEKVYSRRSAMPRSHASQLAVLIKEVFDESKEKPTGVLVVQGPGSFTGLRIGVSTAKGLAWSLGIPLYAISTLHYLAHSAGPYEEGQVVNACLRARADEMFVAQFTVRDGHMYRTSPDHVESVEQILDAMREPANNAEWITDSEANGRLLNTSAVPFRSVAPRLESLHSFFSNLLDDYRVKDLSTFEPAYLKEFVARKASKSIFERLPF